MFDFVLMLEGTDKEKMWVAATAAEGRMDSGSFVARARDEWAGEFIKSTGGFNFAYCQMSESCRSTKTANSGAVWEGARSTFPTAGATCFIFIGSRSGAP